MKIRYKYDTRDADAELTRLGRGLDATVIAKLDGRMEQVFRETQAKVHVITGSLKKSGKRSTNAQPYRWRGSVSYGGSTEGPNNPVRYAGEENTRKGDRNRPPGTPHHFFDQGDMRQALRDVEKVIEDFLRGEGRKAKFAKSKGSRRGKNRW